MKTSLILQRSMRSVREVKTTIQQLNLYLINKIFRCWDVLRRSICGYG